MGADNVLLGSDHPFDMGDPDPLSRLAEAGLNDTQIRAISGGNAQRLGLVPPQADAPQ